MNSINPVNVDKSAEYHNNLQTAFRERIGAKEENSSLFSNALGDGPVIKVEISSLGAEMSEKVKNGEMPQLSCWEIMDKKKAESEESIMSGDKSELR